MDVLCQGQRHAGHVAAQRQNACHRRIGLEGLADPGERDRARIGINRVGSQIAGAGGIGHHDGPAARVGRVFDG